MSSRTPQRFGPLTRALVAAPLLIGCAPGGGPAGAANEAAPPAGGAITIWTDSTELFMEHPALVVGAPDKFAVHLTDITDFAPLRSGRITLRFTPRGEGVPLVVTQEEPRAPGIYGPAPAFTQAGIYDLTITVESPQAHDVIEVTGLTVHGTVEEAPREVDGGDEGISFLKEQQWKTPGFATAFAEVGQVTESFSAPGRIVPAAGRLARISAPVAGMVDTDGLAGTPVPGQRVARGQVLAVLTPALGEGGSAYAQARAALREAEDEHARATRLLAAEATPARRVHEAEIRLAAAREAMAAFGGRESEREDGRIALRSPLPGVVASRSMAPGSRVEAGAELFTVVDPSVLWLEASISAADAARVGTGSRVTFRIPGGEAEWSVRRPVSIGIMLDSLSRTVPVLYEVPNPDGVLKIGMLAQVAVGTGRLVDGVVIPSSAVLDEDGRPIAYVQVDGELFEKRVLETGASSGGRTVVVSGIRAGERVVTGAAYQVRLASLSTSVPAQGHEH